MSQNQAAFLVIVPLVQGTVFGTKKSHRISIHPHIALMFMNTFTHVGSTAQILQDKLFFGSVLGSQCTG
jgi:hypothetical protein